MDRRGFIKSANLSLSRHCIAVVLGICTKCMKFILRCQTLLDSALMNIFVTIHLYYNAAESISGFNIK